MEIRTNRKKASVISSARRTKWRRCQKTLSSEEEDTYFNHFGLEIGYYGGIAQSKSSAPTTEGNELFYQESSQIGLR